jgi:hypothetical protein
VPDARTLDNLPGFIFRYFFNSLNRKRGTYMLMNFNLLSFRIEEIAMIKLAVATMLVGCKGDPEAEKMWRDVYDHIDSQLTDEKIDFITNTFFDGRNMFEVASSIVSD